MKVFAQAATVLSRCGILSALEAVDRDPGRIRVIAYHRIDELDAEPDLDPGLISATPADFRAQLEVIARRYTVVSLDDLVAAHRGEGTLPARAVLLTFDDGYLDFERRAWPILQALGLPAVLFVPTSFPGEPGAGFWWDRLHSALIRTDRAAIDDPRGKGTLELGGPAAIRHAHRVLRTWAKSLPHAQAIAWLEARIEELGAVPSLHRVLDWDALRKLAGDGLSVCPHGHLHALATALSPAELVEDLTVSKKRVEAEIGPSAATAVMAYPANASDAEVRRAVRSAGYELAFGGRRGIDRLPFRDPYEIMRIPVNRHGMDVLRAQLRPGIAGLGRVILEGRARLRA